MRHSQRDKKQKSLQRTRPDKKIERCRDRGKYGNFHLFRTFGKDKKKTLSDKVCNPIHTPLKGGQKAGEKWGKMALN